ncbi:MAG: hypothetical protein Q4F83_06870 [Eubacteriales bacterium]|nr:hypothetical protein [Eubacteriales bacterium]
MKWILSGNMQKFFYNYSRKTNEIVIDKPRPDSRPVNNFSEIIQQQHPVSHAIIPVAYILADE